VKYDSAYNVEILMLGTALKQATIVSEG